MSRIIALCGVIVLAGCSPHAELNHVWRIRGEYIVRSDGQQAFLLDRVVHWQGLLSGADPYCLVSLRSDTQTNVAHNSTLIGGRAIAESVYTRWWWGSCLGFTEAMMQEGGKAHE